MSFPFWQESSAPFIGDTQEALGETSSFRAKGFLPYEIIIDQSLIPIFFCVGLLALLFLQYMRLRQYRKEGKGIYTFLTLPMKGTQVADAFLLQSLAMVFLYYALWLVVIVVMYFPMMHWMVSLAAKQEFLMDDGSILTGIDATRNNGLFLAFLRSEFLGTVYSLDWKAMLCVLCMLFSWQSARFIWDCRSILLSPGD